MIIALPCIAFSIREREIINENGFISFPQFLDNHYVAQGEASVKWLQKNIEKYHDKIEYAILPDEQPTHAKNLLTQHPNINWIWPLHNINNDITPYTWIGYPHRKQYRNYNLQQYLTKTTNHKRWYLGFWNQSNPHTLQHFHGYDTTLPETYAGKYGKLWHNWNQSEKAHNLTTRQILTHNIITLKHQTNKLTNQKQTQLTQTNTTLHTAKALGSWAGLEGFGIAGLAVAQGCGWGLVVGCGWVGQVVVMFIYGGGVGVYLQVKR